MAKSQQISEGRRPITIVGESPRYTVVLLCAFNASTVFPITRSKRPSSAEIFRSQTSVSRRLAVARYNSSSGEDKNGRHLCMDTVRRHNKPAVRKLFVPNNLWSNLLTGGFCISRPLKRVIHVNQTSTHNVQFETPSSPKLINKDSKSRSTPAESLIICSPCVKITRSLFGHRRNRNYCCPLMSITEITLNDIKASLFAISFNIMKGLAIACLVVGTVFEALADPGFKLPPSYSAVRTGKRTFESSDDFLKPSVALKLKRTITFLL
jgi:hypothetical protein